MVLIEDLERLKLQRSCKLYCEWTEITTRHNLVLDSLGLILGNQFGTCDTTLGTSLVEEVDYGAAKSQTLGCLPVQTSESLPVTIEVICLVDVGVGLAKVTEAGPELDVLGNHVTWIQLDENLRNLCYDIASGVDFANITIVEGDAGFILLVSRLLISQEEVEIESLEWMSHCIGCPTPCLDIVSHWRSFDFTAMLEVESCIVVGL